MRRAVTVTIVAMMALVWLGPPAGASVPSPFSFTDPAHDVSRAKGDITAVKIVDSSTIKLSLHTRTGANPTTDNGWTHGVSTISFLLYTDTGSSIDWQVSVSGSPVGPQTEVVNRHTNSLVCTPTFSFFGGNGYLLSFPRTCIGSPGQFRVRAESFYDYDTHTHATVHDKAPDSATTPNVTFAA